jgi:hypothetical protein
LVQRSPRRNQGHIDADESTTPLVTKEGSELETQRHTLIKRARTKEAQTSRSSLDINSAHPTENCSKIASRITIKQKYTTRGHIPQHKNKGKCTTREAWSKHKSIANSDEHTLTVAVTTARSKQEVVKSLDSRICNNINKASMLQ